VTPFTVLSASMLQLALAATFVVIPAVGRRCGPYAQWAAESEVARQKVPAAVLAEHRINFGASRTSVVVAVSIGLCLAALASLNLAGNQGGRIVSWIFLPIVFILGCIIMPGEVFPTWYIESAFKKTGDPVLVSLNVKAFVDAAVGVYPAWFPWVTAARLLLATLGSLLASFLLAMPSANVYFG